MRQQKEKIQHVNGSFWNEIKVSHSSRFDVIAQMIIIL